MVECCYLGKKANLQMCSFYDGFILFSLCVCLLFCDMLTHLGLCIGRLNEIIWILCVLLSWNRWDITANDYYDIFFFSLCIWAVEHLLHDYVCILWLILWVYVVLRIRVCTVILISILCLFFFLSSYLPLEMCDECRAVFSQIRRVCVYLQSHSI